MSSKLYLHRVFILSGIVNDINPFIIESPIIRSITEAGYIYDSPLRQDKTLSMLSDIRIHKSANHTEPQAEIHTPRGVSDRERERDR